METLKKWLPELIAAVVAAAGYFVEPAQAAIAAHPALAAVLAALWSILGRYLPRKEA